MGQNCPASTAKDQANCRPVGRNLDPYALLDPYPLDLLNVCLQNGPFLSHEVPVSPPFPLKNPKTIPNICQTKSASYERSAKLQLKNAIFGQSYLFWEFIILFYNRSRHTFYTSTPASAASLTSLRFLLQRWKCMVWYDTCHCDCKSQLHRPFSSSETSFECSLLEDVRMSSHSMLQAFHWPASA